MDIEKMKFDELNEMVTFSRGNSKIGEFTSNISLSPKGVCRKMPCYKKCYAVSYYRWRKEVRASWDKNYKLALNDPELYFRIINRQLQISLPAYFRWHVGGELLSKTYLLEVVKLAERNKQTKFLLYSKRYRLLSYLSYIPNNLSVIMSIWTGLKYPKLPFRKAFTVTDPSQYDGVRCTNYCPDCHACWDAGRDIIFDLR